jgi:hypothetical protein
LNPGDAIRGARRNALTQLAAGDASTTAHITSELFVTGGNMRGGEFSHQDILGSVRDSQIVGMWAKLTPDPGSTTRVRHVYATACRRGSRPPELPDPAFPAWLLDLPESLTRACALGVGGPTLDPRDQYRAALRDGRQALAAALESRLHQIIIDTGRANPRVASQLETTRRALARAATAETLRDVWRDETGTGPLGLSEVLYGLVCIPG